MHAIIEVQSELLSLAEAGALIGVGMSGIYYLKTKGDLPVRKIGGRYVVLRSDAAALAERRRRQRASSSAAISPTVTLEAR